jgi:RNA polymerase sigma-B factor
VTTPGDERRLPAVATEEELLQRFAETRDPALREELVRRYERFARAMARRYEGRGESSDDLFQVAYVGLVHAIDRFDPRLEKSFVSYAAPTVLGELRRHFRDKVWPLRLPRALQERTRRVDSAIDTLTGRLGRSPMIEEVAAELSLGREEVLEAFEAASRRRVGSLDAPVTTGEEDSEPLIGLIGELDATLESLDDAVTLRALMPALRTEELAVLRMRFLEGMTQSEIGERIGYSQMHVSRMVRGAIERLRQAYGEDGSSVRSS